MALDKVVLNEFQQQIREKERQFEARLNELKNVERQKRDSSYIGLKLGTKTITGIESKRVGSRIGTYFTWRCDCGIEGETRKDLMFKRTPSCKHPSKKIFESI